MRFKTNKNECFGHACTFKIYLFHFTLLLNDFVVVCQFVVIRHEKTERMRESKKTNFRDSQNLKYD